jgi:hypothetical protein
MRKGMRMKKAGLLAVAALFLGASATTRVPIRRAC